MNQRLCVVSNAGWLPCRTTGSTHASKRFVESVGNTPVMTGSTHQRFFWRIRVRQSLHMSTSIGHNSGRVTTNPLRCYASTAENMVQQSSSANNTDTVKQTPALNVQCNDAVFCVYVLPPRDEHPQNSCRWRNFDIGSSRLSLTRAVSSRVTFSGTVIASKDDEIIPLSYGQTPSIDGEGA